MNVEPCSQATTSDKSNILSSILINLPKRFLAICHLELFYFLFEDLSLNFYLKGFFLPQTISITMHHFCAIT